MNLEVKDMYLESEELLTQMISQLFPYEDNGCINFGYWTKVSLPITHKERVESQKRLYFELFKYIPNHCQNALEVGCGRGHGVNWLIEEGIETIGIDVLEQQIHLCKKNYPNHKNSYISGSADSLPLNTSSVDFIYSLEAAQHFSSFQNFCNESFRVLKKDGTLVISTYFFTHNESKKKIMNLIPNDIVGFDRAITLLKAIDYALASGFELDGSTISIGDQVFPYYSQWQKQTLGMITPEQLTNYQLNWIPYYTGGGKLGEHPWGIAYKNGWIDYNILIFKKIY